MDDNPAASYFVTQSLLVDGVSFLPSTQSVTLNHVAVDGIEVLVGRSANGNLAVSRLAALRSMGASLAQQQTRILDRLSQELKRFRRLIAWSLAAIALVLVLLKLVVLRSPRWTRSVLSVPVVLVPFGCYALFFGRISLISFLILSGLVSIVLAVVLWRTTYRLAAEWHARWEPCALDVLAAIVLLPLLAIFGILPPRLSPMFNVNIARTSVLNVKMVLQDQTGQGNLASVSIPQVENEAFALKVGSTGRGSVILGRTSYSGSVLGGVSPLRKLQWLPTAWSRPQSIAFCGTLLDRAISTTPMQPAGCTVQGSGSPQVEINAAASVLLSPLEVSYLAKTQVQFEPILLGFDAEGDQRGIHFGNFQSADESPLQVGNGAAEISFTPEISASLLIDALRLRIGDASIGIRSLRANLPVESLTGPLGLRTGLTLQESSVSAPDGTLTIGNADVAFSQTRGRGDRQIAVSAGLRDVVLTSRHTGEPSPWLRAEVPKVALQTDGRMSLDLIPPNFTGDVALRLSRSNDPQLDYQNTAMWTDAPLHFSVDVWKGILNVAQQSVTIHQSIIPQAPASVSLNLEAVGQLVSLTSPFEAHAEAHAHVLRIVSDVPPVGLEVNDLDVLTRVALKNRAADVTAQYSTRWSAATVKSPSVAMPELREISEFRLETHGSLPRIPGNILSSVADIPLRLNFPKQIAFRLSGTWPSSHDAPVVQILTQSGAGVRIADIKTGLTQFSLPDARLNALGANTDVSGIQTANGDGNLSLHSEMLVDLDKGNLRSSVEIPFSNRQGSLALRLQRTPEAFHLELADRLPIGLLLLDIEPFLSQAGFNLRGVTSQAEVKTFAVNGHFSGPELTALDVDLDIPPGLLASVDFSKLSSPPPVIPFHRAEIWLRPGLAAPGGFQLSVSPVATTTSSNRSADIAFTLSGLSFLGTSSDATPYQGDISVASKLNVVLPSNVLRSTNPVLAKLSLAASDFSGLVRSALRGLGDAGKTHADSLRDVTWQLQLHNPSATEPFLEIGPDKASLGLSTSQQLTWRAHEQSPMSELSSSSDVATDLRLHRGELVVDGYVPVQASLSLSGRPSQKIALHLPFLAILAEHLHPADTSDWLWDTKYYDSFWSDYHPSRAQQDSTAIVDEKQFALGPLLIQQIRIPSDPMRIAIGHKDSLQLDLPTAFQMFFGHGNGRLQAEIRWPNLNQHNSPGESSAPLLDSRGGFTFSHLQTGAIRYRVDDGSVPLLEDEIDGQATFRSDVYPINFAALNRMAGGLVRSDDLKGLSARLKFWSNRTDPLLPGAMQFVTTVQLQNLNAILKQITRDLQVQAPPRSLVYQSLLFNFETANGQVTAEPSLVEMRGVKFLSIQQLVVDGTMRVHLGNKGERISLPSLTSLASEFISETAGSAGKK